MSLIGLVIILLFLAVILYFVNTKGAAMNPTIKMLINAVVIIVAVLIVLSAFGVWDEVKSIKVPRL